VIRRSKRPQYAFKAISAVLGVAFAAPSYSGLLGDVPVNDEEDCSSYVNLKPPVDFSKDQEIWITLDRSDKNPVKEVYVRLVPVSSGYTSDAIGLTVVKISDDLTKIRLGNDYRQIKQLSIHGGLNPFGKHPMPLNTGTSCPNMLSVELKP
jgi:hypothetical protein